MPPIFDDNACSGCGLCDSICPADAIYLKSDGDRKIPYLKYPDECWHCGSCRQDCPEGAISIQFPPDMLNI